MSETYQDQVDKSVDRMNRRFFLVMVGKHLTVGVDHDRHGNRLPEIKFWAPLDTEKFTQEYNYFWKPAGEEDAKPRLIQPFKLWKNSPGARKYEGIILDPSPDAPTDSYNMWTGLQYEPQEGDWSLMRDHLWNVICRQNEELYDYVLRWCAYAVQYPWLPAEVALVLRGVKGSGKGTFANCLGSVFGRHFLSISNRAHLLGRFNAHLKEVIFLVVDEGFWAGDKEGEGILKQLITEPLITVEQKYIDAHPMPNRLHIMITSNEDWVIPARGMERRFAVLDLSEERAQDHTYFAAMRKQLNEGGISAMLYDLLAMDLTGFNIRKAPFTEALKEQMLHSLSPLETWWFECLTDGQMTPIKSEWGEVSRDGLYTSYCDHVGKAKHRLSKSQLAVSLGKFIPDPGIKSSRPLRGDGRRPRIYEFPPLDECRATWDKHHNVNFIWEDDE